MKKEAIVLYMPALHKGYLDFFTSNGRKVDTIFLINEVSLKDNDPDLAWLFEKDLRAVSATEMRKAVSALGVSDKVEILNEVNLKEFDNIIIPDNDEIVDNVLSVLYPSIVPQKESWFIRWGRKTVLSKRVPVPNAIISSDDLDKEMMLKAFMAAEQSSDWWRQVGVVLLPVNSKPIVSFNQHMPHPQAPYINGDPRTVFKPGEFIELSTAGHAEATAIAYAAQEGIRLKGASIYVTTFPCPPCAWAIIGAGIKKMYYCEGYSQLDAAETLHARGVEIIFVDVPEK